MIGDEDSIIAGIAGLFLCVVIFVCMWVTQHPVNINLSESTDTGICANVIAKDSYTVPDGTTLTKKYKATVNIDGEEFDINLPSKIYDNVEIGSDIEVTIFHKDDKVVYVTYGNVEDEDNKSSKRIKAQKCNDAALGAD